MLELPYKFLSVEILKKSCPELFQSQKNSNEYLLKDGLIKDFNDDWLIEETCDTVTLESTHPLRTSTSADNGLMFHTHECKNDEIAYFKVDVNLIDSLPYAYLGNVCKFYDMKH